MISAQWGHIYWYFIHWSAWFIRDWPMAEKDRMEKMERLKVFYMIMPYLLPCVKCGVHCKRFIKDDSPMDCETLDDLVRWSHRFHNNVNLLMGKEQLDFETVDKQYDRNLAGLPDHQRLYTMANIIANESTKKDPSSPHQIFYREFFKLLPYIFPCSVCSENLGLMIPYRQRKADKIWLDIAIPLLQTHRPSMKDKFVFRYTGWEDDGRAGFLKIYARQRIRLEVCNIYGGRSCVRRYLPVLDDMEYEIYLRGKFERCLKNLVRLSLRTKDEQPLKLAYPGRDIYISEEVGLPCDGDLYVKFQVPRYENIVILEISFIDKSTRNDRFTIKELTITPFQKSRYLS